MALAAEPVRSWGSHHGTRQEPAWTGCQPCVAAASKSSPGDDIKITPETSTRSASQRRTYHDVTRHPSVLKLPSVRSGNKRPFSDIYPLASKQHLSTLPKPQPLPALPLLNRFAAEFSSNKGLNSHPRPWLAQEVLITLEESCTFVITDMPPDMRINDGRKAKKPNSGTGYYLRGNEKFRNAGKDDIKLIAQSNHTVYPMNSEQSKTNFQRTSKSRSEIISSSTQYIQTSQSSKIQAKKTQSEILCLDDSTRLEKQHCCLLKEDRTPETCQDSTPSACVKITGRVEQKQASVTPSKSKVEHATSNSSKYPTWRSSCSGTTSHGVNEGSSQASHSKKPARANGERPKRTNLKRKTSEKEDRNEGNAGSDENERGKAECFDAGLESPAHDRLACPHYAHDCERYCRCRGLKYKSCYQGFSDMTRLIEHLKRVHCILQRCDRCLRQFENSESLKEHSRLKDPCTLRPENSDDVISQRQLEDINTVTRRKGSDESKWRQIFKIIYSRINDEDIPSPWVKCPGHRQQRLQDAITKHRNDVLNDIDTLCVESEDTKQRLRQSIRRAYNELMEANSGKKHRVDQEVSQISETSKDITPTPYQPLEDHSGQVGTSHEAVHRQEGETGTLDPSRLDLRGDGFHPTSWGISMGPYPPSTASFDLTEPESVDYTIDDASTTMDDIITTPRSHQSLPSYGLKPPHRQFPPGMFHDAGSGIGYLDAVAQGNNTFMSDTTDEYELARVSTGEGAEERLPQAVKDSQEPLGFHGLNNDLNIDPQIEMLGGTPGLDATGLSCTQHGRLFSMCTENCTGHIGVFAALGPTRVTQGPRPTN